MGVLAIFSRGLSYLCLKNILTVSEKTAMLTCKFALPDSDSPHPVIIRKNPGYWSLHLARRNEFRCFV